MKKRCLVFLLTVCLVFALAAGALAATDLTGEWYLFEISGVNLLKERVSATLILNKDKKFEFTVTVGTQTETETGTWEYRKKDDIVWLFYKSSGMRETYYLNTSGSKVYLWNNVGMRFSREKTPLPQETVAAESEKAFEGTWKIRYVEYEDRLKPPEPVYDDEGICLDRKDIRLQFAPGEVRMIVPRKNNPFDETIPLVFEDGALVMQLDDDTYNRFQLTEEGNIYCTLEPADSNTVYLERAE